ncbi:MAG: hypothetical protein ACT4QG_14780 [Sporichthyaceae bacterium]
MNRLLRTSATTLAAGLFCAGALLVTAGTSRAETTFDASAAAYGVLVTIANPSAPLGVVPEGSGPTAQARLNAVPRSSSLASFPYPGDSLVGLPGLMGALVPGLPPLPDYPLYAGSELGDEAESVTAPGVELVAESSDRLAASRAQSLTAASGYLATARVEKLSDGSVVAVAEAHQSAIALAGLATLDGVRSVAKVTAGSDAKLTRHSSLEIDSFRLPGIKFTGPDGTAFVGPDFGFRDGEFHLNPPSGEGQAVPIPARGFFAALNAAGITGSYQAAQQTKSGVIAPVLSLAALLPSPPDNPLGLAGATRVTLDLGQSIASVAAQVIPEVAAPALLPPVADDNPPAVAPPAAELPAVLPVADLPAVAPRPVAVPATDVTSLTVATGILPANAFDDLRRSGVGGLYLVLAGACLAGVLVTGLVLRGVRT